MTTKPTFRRCLRCNLTLIVVGRAVVDGVAYTEWECVGCWKRTQTRVRVDSDEDSPNSSATSKAGDGT